jgi:HEAT repeat protein
VWIGVVATLGEIGEPAKAAVPDLILLLQDKDGMIQSRAKSALEKLGYKR